MRPTDLFTEAATALVGNKVRSSLTVLGIVIGIGSVIALVAVGQGATTSVTQAISSLGSNLLVVVPGASRTAGPVSGGLGSAQTLTKADADALTSGVSAAKAVSADITKRFQITATGTNTNTSVIGTQPAYAEIHNQTSGIGTFFSDADVKTASRVAVLGPTTRDNLFGQGNDPSGQKLRINKIEFTVIGVTTAKGGSGFSNPDDAIYIPLTTMPATITTTPTEICRTNAGSCTGLIDLSVLTASGKYLVSLPYDPQSSGNTTGYRIYKDANNRVTVDAPKAEQGATISVSR